MNFSILKLAFRNLLRHRTYTLINLSGLAITLAACIIIFVYISYEYSFDRHIPEADRTYRIVSRLQEGNYWSRSFACYTDALAHRPEIEDMTSFINSAKCIIDIDESEFTVPESVIADTAFLDFFDIEMISGRKEDLGQPDIVFITMELAEKIFPGTDPLGKEILLRQIEGNTADSLGYFTVGGIVNPLPSNTHFGYQMIFSQKGNLSGLLSHLKAGKFFASNVYVRLHKNFPAAELESALGEVLIPYLNGVPGPPVEAFNSKLQAVREIHFTPNMNREPRPVTRKSMIFILLSVGVMILTLMSSNFISVLIVQAYQQRKDTGIMRTFGANKLRLFLVPLIRIALYIGVSLVFSLIIVGLMDQYLENIFSSGWNFQELKIRILSTGLLTGLLVTLVATVATNVSGSKNSTIDLLKGEIPSGSNTFSVFGVLTIIQFGIIIFLLGFSIIIGRQINYMENTDLGYQDQNIYIVRIPDQQPRASILVEEIRKTAGVHSASTAHHHPGDVFQQLEFAGGEKKYPFGFRMVDPGIFETLDIRLLKNFGSGGAQMDGWVINETFYNQLLQDYTEDDISASNFRIENEDPDDSRSKFIIAAVMEDFHYASLHNNIGNFAFVIRHPEQNYNRWLMVRYHDGHAEEVNHAISEMMNEYFPGRFTEIFLLEDNLKMKYKAAHNLSGIIRSFTLLAILIACFGLYGLSLFLTQRRTREIGVRKVHGSTTLQLIILLNNGFLKWLGIAFVIACPLTLWAINRWLQNFAYHITPEWWIFAMTGILTAAIAMTAVTWQTSIAARLNPVNALRYE